MLNLDLYQSWDDSHAETNYPFVDGASLLTADGTAVFPVGAITDAAVGSRSLVDPVYVSSVQVTAATVRVEFGQNKTPIAYAEYGIADSGWLPLVALNGVVYAGKIKVDPARTASIFSLGIGAHAFTAADTALIAYCVFLSPASGVRGIVLPSGEIITGDITLSLGSGLEAELVGANTVKLNATGLPFVGRDNIVMIRRAVRRVDVVVNSAGGANSTSSVYPVRGSITVTTDNTDARKSAAVVFNAAGAEVTVEVSQ